MKREKAEEDRRMKEEENEIMKLAFDMNGRLDLESARMRKQANLKYQADLEKQIEYNNELAVSNILFYLMNLKANCNFVIVKIWYPKPRKIGCFFSNKYSFVLFILL